MSTNINAVNVALETIAFQDSSFGEKLETIFKEMSESKLTKDVMTVFEKRMSDIVKERTGLNIAFHIDSYEGRRSGPCIYLPDFSNGDVIKGVQEIQTVGTAKAFIDKIKNLNDKNTVDLKNAKVTGAFTQLPHNLHIAYPFMVSKKLTIKEMVAVTLHEIGHAFTCIEYSSRFSTANQVLAGMLRAKNEDDSTQEYVFSVAGEILKGDKRLFEKAEQVRDAKAITILVMNEALYRGERSATNSTYTDTMSCEQLADQFCARFGYGRHVVTGLEKIYGNMSFFDKTTGAKRVIIQLLGFVTGPAFKALVSTIGTFGTFIVAPFIVSLIVSMCVQALMDLAIGGSTSLKTYDHAVDRAKRVREQLIEYVKNVEQDKELISKALNDIKALDGVIAQYNDEAYRNLYQVFFDFVIKSRRKAADISSLQRQLEELAANNLFIKAAELRTMQKV